jgi:hypothetical protein
MARAGRCRGNAEQLVDTLPILLSAPALEHLAGRSATSASGRCAHLRHHVGGVAAGRQQPAAELVLAPQAVSLAERHGRLVLSTGGLLLAAGVGGVWIGADAVGQGSDPRPIVPGLVVAGAGLSLLIIPLANVVLAAIPSCSGESPLEDGPGSGGGALDRKLARRWSLGTGQLDYVAVRVGEVDGALAPWTVSRRG